MKVWWLGFALVTSQLVAQGEFSRVDTLLLAPEVYVGGVGWGDFDGDGRRDLLLATRTGENFLDRKVQIHLQNATTGRFSSEPDRSLDLPEDLSCLAAGDLHPDVGDEVLLLGARSTVVWRWRQEG
ncbi:MAG: hypothetical protein KDB53_06450, partial [Planctomycetes bacterium]|nr:hypothetical protein [Planctomycetota bacterium]